VKFARGQSGTHTQNECTAPTSLPSTSSRPTSLCLSRCAAALLHPSSVQSMNATVNWLKRRVSLTTSTTQTQTPPPIPIQHTQQPDPRDSYTPVPDMPASPRNLGASRPHTPLMQHEMLDPASPLSILAATSKLTTFPYGELQALNARMNVDTRKVHSMGNFNGIHMEMNGVQRASEENGVVAAIPKPLRGIKVRPRERVNQTTHQGGQTIGNALVPSSLPATRHPENTAPGTFQSPLFVPPLPAHQATFVQPAQPLPKQRNVTTSVLPRTRSATNVSHKKSSSLSSTQNTRSSKRLKTSHPAAIPPVTVVPTQNASVDVQQPPPTTPTPAATKQKRVLPVRHGHIDILDGEISLLSTPQRLDSTSPPPSVHPN
jgi:hypothetical protein